MRNTVADDEAVRLVERLRDATNSHDPDGVAACFTPDYCSETPLHPARSFTGRDQVRRNQEKIFTFVPDLTAELLRSTVDGTTIWTSLVFPGATLISPDAPPTASASRYTVAFAGRPHNANRPAASLYV